ncbi:RagB/SusD family nutrient uptake outer membrane protein [Dysgonomonas sp. Marseille-P4677]|uniref:RagB/SusD family nutrient uptake outer membrane protein n=1 Tax=Dysgonomonas sp. Marseille-P4677 TaxID=2364790 RepID=UPI001F1A8D30|nr:RagB/SusD family nutrient uptake outer membrane protein [Dysgonomonas sp. Marseille-P4677]
MKNIIFRTNRLSICLIIILLVFSGCNDLLDKNPNSSISDTNFWTGENDALLALTGCYRFQTGWSHDDFATPQGLLYLDLAGGNGTEKENFSTLMASANTVATNGNIRWYWGNAYVQIAKHNTFLDNISNCPMDEDKKEIWISEIKCLRAYFFFYLAFHFNDVPMPLTSLTLAEANSIHQTPQSDVYTQVENDLKNAISLLPEERPSGEYGRLTKGAAQVLLSRVYLAQNKWSDAASILRNIIYSNKYELDRRYGENSYEKLFQIGGEYSPETIFCIMGVEDLYTNSRYQYLYPEAAYGGWHQFAPYNELVKEYFCIDGKDIKTSTIYNDNDPYANRDLRLYASIFLPPLGSFTGTKYNNITYDCFNGANSADYYSKFTLFNGYCPKKGCDPSITNNLGATPTYTPLMRYAEVLLSYLEALNESDPSAVNQSVLDLTINDIRDRVKLPPIKMEDVPSQELVRKAVRKERRVELAFEGLRYYDVLRWEIAKDELNHTFTGVKLSNNPNDRNYRGSGNTASPVDDDIYYQFEKRTWLPHNRYFPIPQNDLNVNKNLKQNEGYN